MNTLAQVFIQGFEICRSSTQGHTMILSGLFLTGLVGSLSHCAGMCGPFVLTQVGARLERMAVAPWARLQGALLVPYHLGRMTTYMGLGALVGGVLGSVAGGGSLYRVISGVLLTLAGLAVMAQAYPKLGSPLGFETRWSHWVSQRAKGLFVDPVGLRGYGLGVVLGFIPCGLLYAALSTAATMGSGIGGALSMAAFCLGTVPILMLIGGVGQVAANLWRRRVLGLVPYLMVANGMVLFALALSILIA